MVNNNLVGAWATYPSEKWWSESQLGWWIFPTEWKKIFQTTNQSRLLVNLLLLHLPTWIPIVFRQTQHFRWLYLPLNGGSAGDVKNPCEFPSLQLSAGSSFNGFLGRPWDTPGLSGSMFPAVQRLRSDPMALARHQCYKVVPHS